MTLYSGQRRRIGPPTALETVAENLRRPVILLAICCLCAVLITWIKGWWEPPRGIVTLIRLWCISVGVLSLASLLQLALARRWVEALNLGILSALLVMLTWAFAIRALQMLGLFSPVMIVPVNP